MHVMCTLIHVCVVGCSADITYLMSCLCCLVVIVTFLCNLTTKWFFQKEYVNSCTEYERKKANNTNTSSKASCRSTMWVLSTGTVAMMSVIGSMIKNCKPSE